MNVTTTSNLVSSTQSESSKKAELTDSAAFSQELKKQLKQKPDTEGEALTKDSSQSKVVEKTEELEDTDDFVIIPAFLRFDRELEKPPTVLTDLHKDTFYMEGTTKEKSGSELLLNSGETLAEKTELSLPVMDLEKSKIPADTVGGNEEDEAVQLSEGFKEKTVAVADAKSIAVSHPEKLMEEAEKVVGLANGFKKADSVQTAEQSLEKVKTSKEAVSAKELVKESERKKPTLGITNGKDKLIEKKPGSTIQETSTHLTHSIDETDQKAGAQTIDFLSERFSDKTNESVALDVKGLETSEAVDYSAAQLSASNQSAQRTSLTSQFVQTAPVSAALEQSPEVISDMMMSVTLNETGDTVYESTLTLTPETLGDIKVELSYSDEILTGQIIFETEEAKQYIENRWQQMKGSLELKGLQVDAFEFRVVEPDVTAQAGQLNLSQESDQSKGEQQQERRDAVQTKLNAIEEEKSQEPPVKTNSSGLNYYA